MKGYRQSRFTLNTPIEVGDNDGIALYNTLTRALILMPENQWMNLLNESSATDPESVNRLLQSGILVKNDIDEAIVFNEWKQRQVHDFSTIRSKVLVTRKCNNRCTYCILTSEPKDMSHETARDMDCFYFEQIESNHPMQVRDDYLGGEPLMNHRIIIESASRRFYFCKGRKIDYGFIITTNGTLLTPKIIHRLKTVGLTAARVSLAGPAELHDRLRPSADEKKTYEKIMENLEKISGLIPISIECQYDAGARDFKRIPEMLDDIKRRNIEVENIAFTPILEKRGGNRFLAEKKDLQKFLFLQKSALTRGFPANDIAPSNACMADFRSFFVFDTDGSIIPCPSLQGGEMAYGNVLNGIDFVAESQLLHRNIPDKCLESCEILPICMGGCRLQALTYREDFNGIDCHYDAYRRLLTEYVRYKAMEYFKHDISN